MKVSVIVAEKQQRGIEIYSISEKATVKDAAAVLNKQNVGALLVSDDENPEKYIGILSERDIIRHCCGDVPLYEMKVGEIATMDMLVVTSEDDLETAREVMSRHHVRHLPVVENTKVIGMITIRDVIKVIDEQKDIQIKHLSDFVGGTYGNNVF